MLLGDDVLDVVGQVAVLLLKQAVLATIGCPSADELPRCRVHC